MIPEQTLLEYGAAYKEIPGGDMIFMEGGTARYYHQLLSGCIRWFNIDDDGREVIQHIIHANECFGEIPLFDDKPYAASAIAEENSVILRLRKEAFQQLLKDHADIHFSFTELLAERLRFKFFIVKTLSSYSPGHRLLALINYLKANQRHYCASCKKLLLTRQQLANMTGLRVETVIRAIKDLEGQKIISINKGKVYC